MSPSENGSTGSTLSLRNLSVGYPEKVVLDGLNLDFLRGEFVALLGPNGAGKTTLLRTLAKLLPPRAGAVLIDDKGLDQFRQRDLARMLSVVLTGQTAPGLMDAFQFVSLGRYPHTGMLGSLKHRDIQVAEESLNLVHAGDLAHRRMKALSDGERQKIFIARALAQEPRIILLDEPTLHLDLKHRMEVMSILRRLCREKHITVVASLHDVDIAAKVADRVALVQQGRILGWGPPEEMLKEETVASLYGFDGAAFNPWLGSIELRCSGVGSSVFVVGGVGSSALLFRMLSRRGFCVSTGVLHANDLDAYVAESLSIPRAVEAPMKPVSDEAFRSALALMGGVDTVIDSGFSVEELNRRNLELIREALRLGKRVLSLRKEPLEHLSSSGSTAVAVHCDGEAALLKLLE